MSAQRIVLIDGDSAVRDSLLTLMSLNGHEVATHRSPAAFLESLDAAGAPIPDCVICSAEPGDPYCLDLYRRLSRSHPVVRFALLLGHQDQRALTEARRIGITHVFSKPIVHQQLLAFLAGY